MNDAVMRHKSSSLGKLFIEAENLSFRSAAGGRGRFFTLST